MGGESGGGAEDPRGRVVRNDASGIHTGALTQVGVVHGDVVTTVTRAPLRRPAQVPPSTRWWWNRSGALAEWRRWLDEAGRRAPSVAVLSGMHGVGKSELARRMAEEAEGRFAGGQLYVDLSRWRDTAGRVDVSGALRGCLRSLGVDDGFLPTELADLANAFRTHTEGESVLVIVEEAMEPAEVRPFIPKADGSVVVAVSDGRLAELVVNDGAHSLPVDPLDAPDALGLLTARCGDEAIAAEREAAELLISWCGGLPLALGVVAGQLALHADQSLSDLVSDLEDERARLDGFFAGQTRSVAAALTLAYQALPPEGQVLYRRLALFPGDVFDADLAAVVAEVPRGTARKLLRGLHDSSLLAADDAPGRYRFHALVRLHAARLAARDPEPEQAALALRVTRRHVRWTACADRALMGGRLRIFPHDDLPTGADDPFDGANGKREALAWLSAERANALAVLRDAVARGFFAEAWPMAEALSALYLHHRHVRDWIESAELGIVAASRDGEGGNAAARARLRCLLSRPLLDLGEVDRARDELETAVAEADTTDNLLLRASAREFQGRLWEADDPARAIALFRQCAELSERAGSPRGVAIAHFFTGCAETAGGHPERALATLASALRLLVDEETGEGDRRMGGRVRVAMGMAHRALGRTAEARAALARGADHLRNAEATHYELPARKVLAEIAEAEGDTAALRAHLGRALEILEAGGGPEAAAVRTRLDALDEGD
ncbi:hypothetical protein [Streptomyces radicis]|nr:hypothetical protein [Streptomyces radicis]